MKKYICERKLIYKRCFAKKLFNPYYLDEIFSYFRSLTMFDQIHHNIFRRRRTMDLFIRLKDLKKHGINNVNHSSCRRGSRYFNRYITG